MYYNIPLLFCPRACLLFVIMQIQGMATINQPSANEPLCVKVECITINHERMKGLLVPIYENYYAGVGCTKPCNADGIIRDVLQSMIGEANA